MQLSKDFLKSIFKCRGLLMVPPIVFAVLFSWSEVGHKLVVFGVGVGIFITGLLLRIWSQVHLHYRLKVKKILTTTGPYAYVRNPVYIANTIMLVAVVIMSELIWFAPVVLIYCMIVYGVVVRYEESHLLDKYNLAYREYIGRVPRWMPRLRKVEQGADIDVRQFLIPALLAEAPSLLLLVPFLVKEILKR